MIACFCDAGKQPSRNEALIIAVTYGSSGSKRFLQQERRDWIQRAGLRQQCHDGSPDVVFGANHKLFYTACTIYTPPKRRVRITVTVRVTVGIWVRLRVRFRVPYLLILALNPNHKARSIARSVHLLLDFTVRKLRHTHHCLCIDHAHNHDNSLGLSTIHGNLYYHDRSILFHSYLQFGIY